MIRPMSWIALHQVSEGFASEAEAAVLQGRRAEARKLYARAAAAEEDAVGLLDPSKTRTIGISAVSAASLYYKAEELARAEEVAGRWLGFATLPGFAREQLRSLLQSIWAEQNRQRTSLTFAPGQVLVSVKGGEVVHGGAPLDLIVDKVKVIQTILHRTTEFLGGLALRKRGGPSQDVREMCRPWLFQAEPGSYQFAVAIQDRRQLDMLRELPASENISECFLQVLRLGIEDPHEGLSRLVPDAEYRDTFLKLARNLAPTGATCDRLEVRSSDQSQTIGLDANVRDGLNRAIRAFRTDREISARREESLRGILRAVHLDKDWLELATDGQSIQVNKVGDHVDDLIGPMVNKPVVVHATTDGNRFEFLDIEPED